MAWSLTLRPNCEEDPSICQLSQEGEKMPIQDSNSVSMQNSHQPLVSEPLTISEASGEVPAAATNRVTTKETINRGLSPDGVDDASLASMEPPPAKKNRVLIASRTKQRSIQMFLNARLKSLLRKAHWDDVK